MKQEDSNLMRNGRSYAGRIGMVMGMLSCFGVLFMHISGEARSTDYIVGILIAFAGFSAYISLGDG